jgi:Tfp pilus assembly protein PilO
VYLKQGKFMKIESATVNIATLVTVLVAVFGLAVSAAVGYSNNNERFAKIETEKAGLREANERQDKEIRELRNDIKDSLREIKTQISALENHLLGRKK